MLHHLHIRNVLLLQDLRLSCGPAMTVLTGETGAGKSVLFDALGLALGQRADLNLIGPDGRQAEVAAEFDIAAQPTVEQWLQQQDLVADDGSCILRRLLSADGRSRAYINGRPVPLQQLQQLAMQLVDIHGQHAQHALLRAETQRQLLDQKGGHGARRQRLQELYQRGQQLRQLLAEGGDEQQREQRSEWLRYQLAELSTLPPAEEWAELEERHRRWSRLEEMQQQGQQILDLLDEQDKAVDPLLGEAHAATVRLAAEEKQLKSLPDMLAGALIQVRETVAELQRYLATLEIEPQQAVELEQHISNLHQLARKHRCEVEGLPALQQRLQEELETLQQREEKRAEYSQEEAAVRAEYAKEAQALSECRQRLLLQVNRQISRLLESFGMEGAQSLWQLQHDSTLLAPHGQDRLQWLLRSNPGQAAGPLSRVASGGELSRVALAAYLTLANLQDNPTRVFDEVDAGIGGGIAEQVGSCLRQLAVSTQLFCVTHLPQVACYGQHHWHLSKRRVGNSTMVRLHVLDAEQRVVEIGRMLGGETASAEEHARRMLNQVARSESANSHGA